MRQPIGYLNMDCMLQQDLFRRSQKGDYTADSCICWNKFQYYYKIDSNKIDIPDEINW